MSSTGGPLRHRTLKGPSSAIGVVGTRSRAVPVCMSTEDGKGKPRPYANSQGRNENGVEADHAGSRRSASLPLLDAERVLPDVGKLNSELRLHRDVVPC